MELIAPNSKVPELSLLNQDSKEVKLSDITKGLTLLYFYPKALTSGCTTQACGIRDGIEELKKRGITVYGISPDKPEKLQKFIEKENLNFTLLSDPENKVSQAFGAYGLKKMCGREYMGVYRVSFIAKDNKIVTNFPKVKPKEHLDMVLRYLDKE
ncbi:MAG: thioredoxin-dependent thiol peroxidase [Ruminobacter sp.]|nr:thioredoxin-dependent thiol peroxidase [Ruminobacter sp.]